MTRPRRNTTSRSYSRAPPARSARPGLRTRRPRGCRSRSRPAVQCPSSAPYRPRCWRVGSRQSSARPPGRPPNAQPQSLSRDHLDHRSVLDRPVIGQRRPLLVVDQHRPDRAEPRGRQSPPIQVRQRVERVAAARAGPPRNATRKNAASKPLSPKAVRGPCSDLGPLGKRVGRVEQQPPSNEGQPPADRSPRRGLERGGTRSAEQQDRKGRAAPPSPSWSAGCRAKRTPAAAR